MIFSKVFANIEICVIGRQFEGSDKSPVFGIRDTVPKVQSEGNIPVKIDAAKIHWKRSGSRTNRSLQILVLIPSTQLFFETSIFIEYDNISSVVGKSSVRSK